jgi:hypothetical protein
MRPATLGSILLLSVAGEAASPRAEAASPRAEAAEKKPTPVRRGLAAGAAVVPGILVHGAGQWVLGRPKTALRLLAWEGVGLGLVAAGGIPIVLTGASRKLVGPAAAVAISGFGLIFTGTLAELYGTTGLDESGGFPQRRAVWFESELGYRYLYDPAFRYHNFLVQRMLFWVGPWKLEPSLWSGLDDTVSRARVLTGWRFFGPWPHPRPEVKDGSFLEVELGGTRSVFSRYGFDKWTGEVALGGRFDLVRIDPVLRGSFVDGGVGWGREWVRFDPPGTPVSTNATDLLLARFGFGVYLAEAPRNGEVRLYYDHRRDDWAGGLAAGGIGSGVVGHLGLEAWQYLDPSWGIKCEAQVGSAYLLGLSALYRPGGEL